MSKIPQFVPISVSYPPPTTGVKIPSSNIVVCVFNDNNYEL